MNQVAHNLTPEEALNYPRAIQFPPLKPIFLVEEWEIPLRTPLPVDTVLPFIAFIDDQLQVHFELNLECEKFSNSRLQALLNFKKVYREMASRIIKTSLVKEKRRLIGGISGYYFAKNRITEISYLGILPREETTFMPSEMRKLAYMRLSDGLDKFNVWIGARELHSGTSVVTFRKATQVGWQKVKIKGLRNLYNFYKKNFPLCLLRKQSFYIKKLENKESNEATGEQQFSDTYKCKQ